MNAMALALSPINQSAVCVNGVNYMSHTHLFEYLYTHYTCMYKEIYTYEYLCMYACMYVCYVVHVHVTCLPAFQKT